MTILSVELLDNAISFSHLIWVMNDEDYDKLVIMHKLHISLVREHLKPTTTKERRNDIITEIEELRIVRTTLIQKYTN